MKNKLSNIFLSGEAGNVFRGMLTLLMGAGLARIVGLACIPILTRLYSPEDFGILALYTALVAISAPALTLRYVQAIPLPSTDGMAFNLFSICFKLIVINSLIFSVVLVLFGEIVLGWFNMQELISWWWLIILGSAGTALYELFSLWATRKKQYKNLARAQLVQSVIGNFVKIFLGILGMKPLGLIAGQLLNQSAGIGSLIRNTKNDFKKYFFKVNKNKEKFIARYYQDFVRYRLPSHLLMVLAVQAPIIMMSTLYDQEHTGQLSLAIMALSLPVGLLGQAMSKAYYAEVASIGRKDVQKIKEITYLVQKNLFVIGLPITLATVFLAKPLFIIIFGEEWALSGQYAAILAPYTFLQFTSSPLIQVINIVGSQLFFLVINVSRVLGLFLIWVGAGVYNVNAEQFVVVISVYLFLFYFVMSWVVFIAINRVNNNG